MENYKFIGLVKCLQQSGKFSTIWKTQKSNEIEYKMENTENSVFTTRKKKIPKKTIVFKTFLK